MALPTPVAARLPILWCLFSAALLLAGALGVKLGWLIVAWVAGTLVVSLLLRSQAGAPAWRWMRVGLMALAAAVLLCGLGFLANGVLGTNATSLWALAAYFLWPTLVTIPFCIILVGMGLSVFGHRAVLFERP